MKKYNVLIKLILLRLKFPIKQSARIYYYNKLEYFGYKSAFEDEINFMAHLKDAWTEHSWLMNASACILGLIYLIQKIFF